MLATAVTTQYLLTVFFCWVKGRWHRNNKNHPISLDRFLLLGEREAVWLGPIIIWENGGPQFKAWIVLCKPFVEKSMKRRLFLHSPPPRMILLNYPNVIDFVFLTFCMFFSFLFFFRLLAVLRLISDLVTHHDPVLIEGSSMGSVSISFAAVVIAVISLVSTWPWL